MKFGSIATAAAEGTILAHTLKAGGRTLKKGRRLNAEDVAALQASGQTNVVAARLEPDDVHEDEAASLLAAALCGAGVHASAPFTGRVNLFAEYKGLLDVDAAGLVRVNLLNEAITIATLHPYTVVQGRQMVATIKIIPFAVARAAVEAAQAAAAACDFILRVARFRRLSVGLVQTRLPGTREGVLDKTHAVLARRIDKLDGHLAEELRCAHTEADVAAALRTLLDNGADAVLIAGASAIVDRRDVVPAGIEGAGGVVDHFGMPVDPGNLMLLAHHGDVPVLGLPGCARSPKFNGFDQVLERLAADLPVSSEQIMYMGAGGLLKDVSERPLPRVRAVSEVDAAPLRAPRIAALVLAAGRSQRMRPLNKLLAEIDGVPMVARVVDAVCASQARPVVVVIGHDRNRVEEALRDRDVRLVHNPDYADGLSSTLARGLAALPQDVDGAVVCLGDMPRVTGSHIDRLIAAFDPVEGRAICVPTYDGKRGNPVLWDARFFAEMSDIKGDVGARHLIGEYEEAACEVAMDDPGVLVDVDSREALAELGTTD